MRSVPSTPNSKDPSIEEKYRILKSKLKQSITNTKVLQNEKEQLSQHISQQKEIILSKEAALRNILSEIKEKDMEISKINDLNSTIVSTFNEEQRKTNQEIEKLKNQLKIAHKNNEQLSSDLSKVIMESESKNHKTEDFLIQFDNDSNSSSHIKSMEEKIEFLEKSLEAEKESTRKANEYSEQIKQLLDMECSEKEELLSTKLQLESAVTQLTKEKSDLQTEVDLLHQGNDIIKTNYEQIVPKTELNDSTSLFSSQGEEIGVKLGIFLCDTIHIEEQWTTTQELLSISLFRGFLKQQKLLISEIKDNMSISLLSNQFQELNEETRVKLFKEYKAEFQAHKKEINTLKKIEFDQINEIQMLKSKNIELESDISMLNAKVYVLEEKNTSLKTEMVDKLLELDENRELLSDIQKELDNSKALNSKIPVLESMLENSEKKYQVCYNDYLELKSHLNLANNVNNELQNSITELTGQVDELKAEKSGLLKQLSDLESSYGSLKSFETQIQTKNTSLIEKENDLNNLALQLQEQEANVSKMETDLKNQLSSLHEQEINFESYSSKRIEEMRVEKESFEKEKQVFITSIQEKEKIVKKAEALQKQYEIDMLQMKMEKDNIRKQMIEFDKKKIEIEKKGTELAQMIEEIDIKKESIDNDMKEINEKVRMNDVLHKQIEEEKNENQKLLEEARSSLSLAQQQLADFEQKKMELLTIELSLVEKRAKIEEDSKEIELRTVKADDIERSLKKRCVELDEQSSMIENEKQNIIAELGNIKELQANIDTELSSLESKKKDFYEKDKQLKESIRDFELNRDSQTNHIQQLNTKIEKQSKEISDLNHKIQLAIAKIKKEKQKNNQISSKSEEQTVLSYLRTTLLQFFLQENSQRASIIPILLTVVGCNQQQISAVRTKWADDQQFMSRFLPK